MTDLEALDALWENRHESENVTALQSALDAAIADSPNEYALLWRMARLAHFRGLQSDAAGERKTAHDYFVKGVQAGTKAHALKKGAIEAPLWLGACELELALRQNTLAAMGHFRNARIALERVEKLDETYERAASLRLQGHLTHRRPLMMGGSAANAWNFFNRALELAPDHSGTLLYYADALLTEQKKVRARKLLEQILRLPDDRDRPWEQNRDRQLAREMLNSKKMR